MIVVGSATRMVVQVVLEGASLSSYSDIPGWLHCLRKELEALFTVQISFSTFNSEQIPQEVRSERTAPHPDRIVLCKRVTPHEMWYFQPERASTSEPESVIVPSVALTH